MSKDTLTITDNRTGKTYEVPVQDGTIKAMDLRQIKVGGRRLRADDLRPRLHEHGVLQEPHHLHRRRQGHPQLPRLPDRAARGAGQLPGDRLPAAERRAADEDAVRGLGRQDHDAHLRAREREGADGGLPLRRAPDGDAGVDDGGAQHLLPDGQARARRAGARAPDQPADRQDPDARRVRLPPLDGPAVRVPGQRAQLPRQLPADDVQDQRAQVQGAPGARARARRAVHPARRPRAELLDLGDALDRLLGGRPVLRGGRRDRRALRPAPRRGQRGRAADAAGDRLEGQGRAPSSRK